MNSSNSTDIRIQSLKKQPIRLLLLAVLGFVIVSLGILDYLRIRQVTMALATEKARVLITQVEQATERASIAEESLRLTLNNQLFAVAHLLVSQLAEQSGRRPDWPAICGAAGIDRVDVFDSTGIWHSGSDPSSGRGTNLKLDQYNWDREDWIPGLFRIDALDQGFYGAAVVLQDGSFLRVSIPSSRLLEIRKRVGMSAVLQDLAEHPEVLYAILDTKARLIASTPDLPDWVENPGDALHENALEATGFEAEFIDSPDGPVFEARVPFMGGHGVILRMGIVSESLQHIRSRTRRSIAVRTLLFLMLGLILTAWLLSKQNVQLLQREKSRIEREVRSLEAEKVLSQRLTAMGALAGGVAHEIRNPLNTIGMAAQRLEFQLDPVKHRDQYHRVVHSLRQECGRIEGIISNFLEFARPPASHKLHQNLHKVLEQIIASFEAQAAVKKVSFRVESEEELLFEFDADQLRQAVLNLLRNALEVVPEDTGKIILQMRGTSDQAIIAISDNGPGIALKDRNRIFDLYYTTKASGTGLGLALVHRTAVEHNGRVELDDTPGGGATFTIMLGRS